MWWLKTFLWAVFLLSFPSPLLPCSITLCSVSKRNKKTSWQSRGSAPFRLLLSTSCYFFGLLIWGPECSLKTFIRFLVAACVRHRNLDLALLKSKVGATNTGSQTTYPLVTDHSGLHQLLPTCPLTAGMDQVHVRNQGSIFELLWRFPNHSCCISLNPTSWSSFIAQFQLW